MLSQRQKSVWNAWDLSEETCARPPNSLKYFCRESFSKLALWVWRVLGCICQKIVSRLSHLWNKFRLGIVFVHPDGIAFICKNPYGMIMSDFDVAASKRQPSKKSNIARVLWQDNFVTMLLWQIPSLSCEDKNEILERLSGQLYTHHIRWQW